MKSLTLALIFSFSIAAESKLKSFKLEVYQTDLSIYNSCLVIGKNLNTNMMVEYFAGAVVRFQQLEGVNFTNWEEPATGLQANYEESSTGPNLVLGLRIAYGF